MGRKLSAVGAVGADPSYCGMPSELPLLALSALNAQNLKEVLQEVWAAAGRCLPGEMPPNSFRCAEALAVLSERFAEMYETVTGMFKGVCQASGIQVPIETRNIARHGAHLSDGEAIEHFRAEDHPLLHATRGTYRTLQSVREDVMDLQQLPGRRADQSDWMQLRWSIATMLDLMNGFAEDAEPSNGALSPSPNRIPNRGQLVLPLVAPSALQRVFVQPQIELPVAA